jgi:hypothetical protein
VEVFIVWAGFAGAWLLVAGPIFQAAIEFSEQDMEGGEFAALAAKYTPPPRYSGWWWVLPPVGYVLHRRWSRRAHREMLQLATPEQRRMFAQLGNKATGWTMVASAGILLALNETWGVKRHYHWPALAFWLLAVAMTVLSASYTAARMGRDRPDGGWDGGRRPGRGAGAGAGDGTAASDSPGAAVDTGP